MKMLNNKGFAISTVLYSLLVMATLILFLLIGNLSFERRSTDDFVSDIEDELNSFFSDQNSNLLSSALLFRTGQNGDIYDDGVDTFIIGKDPNNYVMYSNMIWRAVLVNNASKTVKLVTQDNIATMVFNETVDSNFGNSDIKEWLNDASASGFLSRLNNYPNFIVTDSEWSIEVSFGSERPEGTTVISDVGLLNEYEFNSSYHGDSATNSYLVNGSPWWTLTRWDVSPDVLTIDGHGGLGINSPTGNYGVRPTINLKPGVVITSGDGTLSNPYKLDGDLVG